MRKSCNIALISVHFENGCKVGKNLQMHCINTP